MSRAWLGLVLLGLLLARPASAQRDHMPIGETFQTTVIRAAPAGAPQPADALPTRETLKPARVPSPRPAGAEKGDR